MKDNAFTIIELLVVIFIISILSVIFFWNMNRNMNIAQLQEATSQLSTDFEKSRSLSQRSSSDNSITLTNISNFSSYQLTNGSNTPITMTLPYGVTATCTSGCTTSPTVFTYSAPYGEVTSSNGIIITLSSPMSGITPMEVHVLGVTGKVIVMKQGSI